ncbi:MAG: hypothetical protein WCE23_11620 [Candidatus Binatus sp.]|uniref:hypothetical protein n=1 Tax=Candidatus Binatus sp. TaxID=2811406 RepID=UPI003C6689FC
MKNNYSSFAFLFFALLAACATEPVGPPPGSLFEDDQLSVQLTVVDQLIDAHNTCKLGVTLTNKSQLELAPNFEMSIVNQTGHTLDQGTLGFPTVMPSQSVDGVKNLYMVGCSNIASIHLSRIQ